MIVKLLTEHHLEFLSLKGGCRGSSESTLVKMSNCWKSHAAVQMSLYNRQSKSKIIPQKYFSYSRFNTKIGPRFAMRYLVSFLVLQSSR